MHKHTAFAAAILLTCLFSNIFASEQNPAFSQPGGIYAAPEPSYETHIIEEDEGPGITGKWFAVVGGHGIYRHVELDITKEKTMYFASLKGMDDEIVSINATSVTFEGNTLKFRIIDYAGNYSGVLGNDGKIKGNFSWENMDFGVIFSREKPADPQKLSGQAAKEIKNDAVPQQAQPEIPESGDYIEEEVKFENKSAEITLSGTLSLPKNSGGEKSGSKKELSSSQAVVLIAGNEARGRDAEFAGHKPFSVIAGHFAKNGIAVLRYDKRGCGNSTGSFDSASTEDFAKDAEAAVEYLKTRKEIDAGNIGLLGHGEGAVIASMIAARQKRIMFIVLLAPHALPGGEIIVKQKEMTGKAAKIKKKEINLDVKVAKKAAEIAAMANTAGQRNALLQYLAQTYDGLMPEEIPKGVGKPDFIRLYADIYAEPRMRFFLKYDPADALEEVKCPVFALWGAKDLRVSPRDNMKALKTALEKSRNPDVTAVIYPRLNHMFQECKTGLPAEYREIEQTFSPEVLEDVLQWTKKRAALR